LPLADGGDGTLTILEEYLNANKINLKSIDALGRPIEAYYLLLNNVAYIELAIASGLTHLKKEERNPLKTSNAGTGLLIKDALKKGAKKIVLCLGGSATTEAGLSIASELGYQFYSKDGKTVEPKGKTLLEIVDYKKPSNLNEFEFEILCDVNNPLYGRNGAAYVYGPQKGADKKTVELLDKGLQHIATLINKKEGIDINTFAGAGAAGGIAGGLLGLFDANLISGFDFLNDLVGLEEQVKQSDLIITGEGNFDASSLQGKVIGNIIELCIKYEKPLVVFAGSCTLSKDDINALPIDSIKIVSEVAKDLKDSIENAAFYLKNLGAGIDLSK